jgi:DNA-binding response OmpR family regulator
MRVLLVEDDAKLAAALVSALGKTGHAVDPIAAGPAALAALDAQAYDIVLLDIGLPRMDGFEVLKRLRAGHRRIPVLMITARDELDDRLKGLNLGADDYLAKPFHPAELEARMRAILRRAEGRAHAGMSVGNLSIDTATREVRVAGTLLKLSPRDYSVLEILAAHAGKLVNKERIVGAISSWDRDFSSASLEVYVHRLRHALAGSGAEIVTHRGFGYLLRESGTKST